MKRYFTAALLWCRRAEDVLLFILLATLILLAAGQIVQRNIIGNGFVWTDELLRIIVLWLAMLGSMVASRTNNHICMDLLARKLPITLRNAAQRLVFAVTALICGALAWASWRFVAMEAEYDSLLLGHYPSWWFQCVLPVGFALMAWRYATLTLLPYLARSDDGEI